MKSMTGYGNCVSSFSGGRVEVSISSLNHKYLDLKIILPPFYSSLKVDLKKSLEKKIKRGFVEVFVTRTPSVPVPKMKGSYFNMAQALRWKKLYQKMSKDIKIKNNLDLSTLALLPGVLCTDRTNFPSVSEKTLVKKLFGEALNRCLKERGREGQALRKSLKKNLTQLMKCFFRIKKASHQQVKKIRKHTLASKNGESSLFRQDIQEELLRWREHIKVFRHLLSAPAPYCGKKLAFYLQEMIREVNTAGSKSQNVYMIHQVVLAKTLIEQMREQVQNIE